MKGERKILLRIIFLLAVLSGPEINAYSNFDYQTIAEHPAKEYCAENCVEYNLLSDVDFFDDEQINQISDFLPGTDYIYQIRIPQSCILFSCYPTPVWQPPKNI